MLCAVFGWIWLSVSEEGNYWILSKYFCYCYYLPFEKGGTIHLKNRDSTSVKDVLCQVWLSHWFNVFNILFGISVFPYYLLLEKHMTLHLKIKMNSLHPTFGSNWKKVWPSIWTNLKGAWAKFVWNWPCVSGEGWKDEVYDDDDGQ